jgi:hypothetical protein
VHANRRRFKPENVDEPKYKMKEKLSYQLMLKILDVIKESGANRTEAECAIDGARAMLPECDLEIKPMMEFYLERR